MTDDGKRRRRPLTAAERADWEHATRSIKPLRRAASLASVKVPASAVTGPADLPKASKPALAMRPASAALPPAPKPAAKPVPPPLAPLGRRMRSRVARGATPIDARIDLHGMTQSEGHDALLRFLRRAQADGARLALVITGKGGGGGHRESERGVLKRQVPHWLRLPEFRALIVGFEDAALGHGGSGALYVRLRAARDRGN